MSFDADTDARCVGKGLGFLDFHPHLVAAELGEQPVQLCTLQRFDQMKSAVPGPVWRRDRQPVRNPVRRRCGRCGRPFVRPFPSRS